MLIRNDNQRYCNWCSNEIFDSHSASICWDCLNAESQSEEDEYEEDNE